MNQDKIYNGTNHEITFYSLSKNNGAIHIPGNRRLENSPRRDIHFYATGPVSSSFGREKDKPLADPGYGLNCIPYLSDWVNYEMIVVSWVYVDYCKKISASDLKFSEDYLDRLYTTIPLYSDETRTKKIGVVGLKKAFPPKTLIDYDEDLIYNRPISGAAFQIAFKNAKENPNIDSITLYKINTSKRINDLCRDPRIDISDFDIQNDFTNNSYSLLYIAKDEEVTPYCYGL